MSKRESSSSSSSSSDLSDLNLEVIEERKSEEDVIVVDYEAQKEEIKVQKDIEKSYYSNFMDYHQERELFDLEESKSHNNFSALQVS